MHWGLSHLLPYFADWPLAEVDVEAVDTYRAYKVEEAESIRRAIERRKPKLDERGRPRRPLNAASINKTLKLLSWVLSIAVEYGHIDRNPAEGRRRRCPNPSTLLSTSTRSSRSRRCSTPAPRLTEARSGAPRAGWR
jgi:hypothetical protein